MQFTLVYRDECNIYHILFTKQLLRFFTNHRKTLKKYTVVGDNINIMKTTFELNFDFY